MTAVPPPAQGQELSNPPIDGISNLRFSNHSDHLLVSFWDKTVRLYDASANVLRGEFMHGGPVLDYCFHDDSSGFSAGADNTVRRCVFSSSKEDIRLYYERTRKKAYARERACFVLPLHRRFCRSS